MSPIPEITNTQLKIIAHAVSSPETFFALVPDSEKDTPQDYNAFSNTNEELDNLVHLGLLENVSRKSSVITDTLEITYGRKLRILKVTEAGKAMLSAANSDILN